MLTEESIKQEWKRNRKDNEKRGEKLYVIMHYVQRLASMLVSRWVNQVMDKIDISQNNDRKEIGKGNVVKHLIKGVKCM